MNKTVFKHKGKIIGKLNHRRHNLRDIVEGLMEKGVYCRIDRVCEYEFDTHVYLTVAKGAKQRGNVLGIAEQFDTAMEMRRAKLPVYRIESNAS